MEEINKGNGNVMTRFLKVFRLSAYCFKRMKTQNRKIYILGAWGILDQYTSASMFMFVNNLMACSSLLSMYKRKSRLQEVTTTKYSKIRCTCIS